MTDIVPPFVRSRMMSGIRGKNSAPEMMVRRLLLAAGYRFRLHRRDLPGTPDIVMPSRKIVIFVQGAFGMHIKDVNTRKFQQRGQNSGRPSLRPM